MTAGAVLAGLLCLLGADAAPPDRPSIVMILCDDMGWYDVGHDLPIDTPNLDKLAEQGMRLTQYYAAASICSPSRAALLTGRYPHSVGVPELASPEPRGNVPMLSLDHDAITIPEALRPRGYRSAIVGKWHLGYARENWPRTHGFDEFWGSLIGTPGYYDVQETYHNETPIEVTGYFTDRITDKAVETIRRWRKSPFFLYAAYNAPHYPLEAPAALVRKYRAADRFYDEGLFAIYAAMVEQLDVGVGRILAALEETQLADRTLVVFCSDNGPSPERSSYGPEGADISNGPLREWKFSHHEGGARVPFIARWPGRIPAGAVRAGPAITMDLMPTFLEAAGASLPRDYDLHGVSLIPLLTGQPWNAERTLFWENQSNAAVLQGRWKLVHQYWNESPFLYDLSKDLGERRDLAASQPEKAAELLELHRDWRQRFYPHPIPRQTKRSKYRFPDL